MTQSRHIKLLQEFVNCLDKENFYQAHESLEEIWFPRRFENDNEMNLLKGFINASVCFELVKRGREESSKKVWKNYLKYRQLLYKISSPYLNEYHSIARKVESINSSNSNNFLIIKS